MSGSCEAYQASDQKVCTRCGTCWDMNDDDPPPCKTAQELYAEQHLKGIASVRQVLNNGR